ncbi:D-isomer specific 2-hydroxyacid dehydrogenase [Xylogone sp. PMI_703]|nr:D-isomer specific 2-hydroxyacid dehydrogenase [Xylogone sp. PMI_703]
MIIIKLKPRFHDSLHFHKMAREVSRGLAPWLTRRSLTTKNSKQPKHLSLAIIDDYLNTSAPHFAHIPPSQLQVTTFKDTIVPTNNAEATRLVERLRPFDLISTVRERTAFPGSLLRQLPRLKLLLTTGTQFEMFDLKAAKELGITVVAAPGLGRTDRTGPQRPNIKQGSAHPTTQHTWALIMALARNVAADDAMLKTGKGWQTGLATGLTGLTLGTVGLGRLGAAVARIAHLAWGMRVVCWSSNLTQEKADQMAIAVGLPAETGIDGSKTFEVVDKEELFRRADVVSMHYVLSDRSRGIVGEKELALMKPSALLVNTSRGPLIDQAALVDTLEQGRIRGAALDVFDIEPLPLTSPWRRSNYWGQDGRSTLLTTPHMGYVDETLMNTWYAETAENVERWLQGKDVLHRLAWITNDSLPLKEEKKW